MREIQLYMYSVIESKLLVKLWESQIIADCQAQASDGTVYCNNIRP